MQNFHYRDGQYQGPRNQELLRELEEIDLDLEEKNRKLQAQQKLEDEVTVPQM